MSNNDLLLLNTFCMGVTTMAGISILARAKASVRLVFGLMTLAAGYSGVVSIANYIGPLPHQKVVEPTEVLLGATVALMMVSTACFSERPLNRA